MLDVATVAQKWAQNASSANYAKGVSGTTADPPRLAIQAKQVMIQRWNDSINSGKWEQGLSAVSQSDWKSAAAGKGSQNYATGVMAAKPKFTAFLTQFLPQVAQLQASIRSMPKGMKGGAESQARIIANMQGMMAIGKSGMRR